MEPSRSRRGGFTLIELLVVISIIALLSSVVLASLNAARDKARLAAGRQFSAQAYRVAADEALGIWDLDEGTGTAAADRSGSGNGGTLLNGPTWSADTQSGLGGSVLFDGSNDAIQVPYTLSLAPTSAISFGGWFKSNSLSTDQRVLSKTESGGYQLSLNENGVCAASSLCALIHVAGTYYAASYPLSNLSTGRWYHAFATFDGETIRLYLDGREVAANTAPSGLMTYVVSNAFCIGSEATPTNCGGGHFAGYIDDVRVFGKALVAAEVGEVYAQGVPRFKYAYGE